MGVGDPMGMAITHAVCSGIGGMRTAGDLVARMQMTRGLKIEAAKAVVADRLGVGVDQLTDPVAMGEVRGELGLGTLHAGPLRPKGIEAKHQIAELLGIEINSVNRLKTNTRPRGKA